MSADYRVGRYIVVVVGIHSRKSYRRRRRSNLHKVNVHRFCLEMEGKFANESELEIAICQLAPPEKKRTRDDPNGILKGWIRDLMVNEDEVEHWSFFTCFKMKLLLTAETFHAAQRLKFCLARSDFFDNQEFFDPLKYWCFVGQNQEAKCQLDFLSTLLLVNSCIL